MWMNQNLLAIFHQSGGDLEHLTNTLFKDFAVPAFDWTGDPEFITPWTFSKTNLVTYILMQYGEQCSIIGDPEQMKEAIAYWSNINLPIWQALYKSLFYKYNPVVNMDYHVSESGTQNENNIGNRNSNHSGTENESDNYVNIRTGNESNSGTNNGSVTRSKNESGTENSVENAISNTNSNGENRKSVAPYNDSTLTENERENISNNANGNNITTGNKSNSNTGSETETTTGGNSGNKSSTENSIDNRDRNNTHSDTMAENNSSIKTGNTSGEKTVKGLNTSGELVTALVSWREYQNVNLYELIAHEFAKQFLIMVW